QAAFTALVQRHGPLVLGVCRQVLRDGTLAEDAFQATFLVFAKRAASIRNRSSLGAWLYRVAYHTALTARASALRRQAHEREAALRQLDGPDTKADHDWQPILHQEVDRLPSKYREPIVLCYLQGRTNEEAARRLGWTKGTVSGRLARARE